MTSFVHKFYLFHLVDYFGIFYPQMVLTPLALIGAYFLKDKVLENDKLSRKDWYLPDELIYGKKQDEDVEKKKGK